MRTLGKTCSITALMHNARLSAFTFGEILQVALMFQLPTQIFRTDAGLTIPTVHLTHSITGKLHILLDGDAKGSVVIRDNFQSGLLAIAQVPVQQDKSPTQLHGCVPRLSPIKVLANQVAVVPTFHPHHFQLASAREIRPGLKADTRETLSHLSLHTTAFWRGWITGERGPRRIVKIFPFPVSLLLRGDQMAVHSTLF